MLRHCPIPRFSSGARRKTSVDVRGKEKAKHDLLENQALHLAESKIMAADSLPPQKVLKIFSINIITQGLPFCRKRVSVNS